jgi:deoxycytidine triphosphate deaminase
VAPALLSAVDVWNYIRVTSMVHPYSDENLKAASYQVRMGGRFIRWEQGRKIEQNIAEGGSITLPANSISFVQTESTFRLPHYMALRFNLQISHVHRGILLGTGPVVDPGFQGKLLIPLHNLTSDPYTIAATEPLIWVEFTKTTFGQRQPEAEHEDRNWERYLFPEDKKHLSPDQYFRRANDLNPIESSIPNVIAQSSHKLDEATAAAADARVGAQAAKRAAEESAAQSAAADKKLLSWGIVGILGAIIAVLGFYLQAISVVQSASSSIAGAEQIVKQAKAAGAADQAEAEKILRLEHRIGDLERRTSAPRSETAADRKAGSAAAP